MKHTRWFCNECKRQWIHAEVPVSGGGKKVWVEGDPCPACGGQYTQKVEYNASFPGGDYGGPAVPFVYPDQRREPSPNGFAQEPPITLMQEKPPVDYWQWI